MKFLRSTIRYFYSQGLSNITLGLLGNPEKYQMRDLKDAGDELGVKTTGFQELKIY